MSNCRSAHRKHSTHHQTIFPSDFFEKNRISDPTHHHACPQVLLSNKKSPQKVSKKGVFMGSPKKTAPMSDSTSNYSGETDHEERVKLPMIQKMREIERTKEFTFPFQLQSEEKTQRPPGRRGDTVTEAKQGKYSKLAPKKLFDENSNPNQGQGKCASSQNLAKKRLGGSRFSQTKESLENSMVKSKSVARSLLNPEVIMTEGYDTDRVTQKRPKLTGASFEKSKYEPKGQFSFPKEMNNTLPVYESSSDEDESGEMFDLINECAFEELCKLASEDTPLPDIYENRKRVMETTFRYQEESTNQSGSAKSNQTYSFADILRKESKVPNTVQHTSAKAISLNKTPFKLSGQNPEECGQQTAYFGADC